MKERLVILIDSILLSVIRQESLDRNISIDQIIEEKLRRSFGI